MIDQAITNYLRHLKYVKGGANNTIMAYRTDLLQFKQVLKQRVKAASKVDGLQASHLKPYLEWLEEKDYQPATVSRKLAALRSFITYLQEEEGLERDGYLENLNLPTDQRSRPKALSPEAIKRLMAEPAEGTSARDIRDAAIIAFLYATGLKAAEAVRVEVGDLDLNRGVLDRHYADIDPLPLGVSYYAVSRYVKEGRPQLLRDRGEQGLFLNQRGTRLTRQGLWLIVKRWAQACNLPEDVSPYTLRHSLTQHLLRAGKSHKEVQRRLGLSSANAIRHHVAAQQPD